MFENLLGKKIVVDLEGANSKFIFGKLILEDSECIKLEMNDSSILTINKDKIISGRPFKEVENHG